jgi:hypothetical protein
LPVLIFLAVTGWTLAYTLAERPEEGLFGLGIVALGAVLYWLTTRYGRESGSALPAPADRADG